MMKQIQLTQGKFALVDDSDFEYLNQFKWYAVKYLNTYYATRNSKKNLGKSTSIRMHRLIMNTPVNMETDHKDMNGLNNQKYNLRICTHAENLRNRNRARIKTDQYKGVYLNKCKYKDKIYEYWRVRIQNKCYGNYKTEKEAALTYNQKALELYGEFAKLNFIREEISV